MINWELCASVILIGREPDANKVCKMSFKSMSLHLGASNCIYKF